MLLNDDGGDDDDDTWSLINVYVGNMPTPLLKLLRPSSTGNLSIAIFLHADDADDDDTGSCDDDTCDDSSISSSINAIMFNTTTNYN